MTFGGGLLTRRKVARIRQAHHLVVYTNDLRNGKDDPDLVPEIFIFFDIPSMSRWENVPFRFDGEQSRKIGFVRRVSLFSGTTER